ncbi:MAG: nitrite reductase/ring-hydroxylating ferredoxin subunit [Gammaproteobacteria bacterium]
MTQVVNVQGDINNGPVGAIDGLSARGLHVGSYKRRMKVSLDRMYENALDWEHLPHLHNNYFAWIELIEAGDWGWRAKVGLGPNKGEDNRDNFIELQLHLDRERHRWISSTLEGSGKGSEIWTHAFDLGNGEIEILADFFVPNIPADKRAQMGAYYQTLYAQLYDEDESMMSERQTQLDARPKSNTQLSLGQMTLGALSSIKPKLPFIFHFDDNEFRLVEDRGELVAHATVCPHSLGPLVNTEVIDGVIECPWHAYKFDIRTGICQTGQQCQLRKAPLIAIDEHSNIVAKKE